MCQDRRVPPASSESEETTCLIAGGGPAGMMLGLLLARAGIKVTVMEKHADFLRDFRGDTVHASTLRLLDELGLGPRFTQIPHRLIDTVRMEIQNQPVNLDLTRLPGGHQHIALVPQWDFLEMVATAAEAEPSFGVAAQSRGGRGDPGFGTLGARGRPRRRRHLPRPGRREERNARRAHGGLRRPLVDRALSRRPQAAHFRHPNGRVVVSVASPARRSERTTRRS